MNLRPAAVAGAFYPADPSVLSETVDRLLDSELATATAESAPLKALIVPHAGYIYSGPIAARAYARLRPIADSVQRVVLLGPAHRVPVHGLALPEARQFATPLGVVEIDVDAATVASRLPQVMESAYAHADEHSLEVQLPFLQRVLPHFKLLPLLVGFATSKDVAEVLSALWGGPETLIVISSDLSHYHPYGMAKQIDRGTADAILELKATLDHEQACGATPVNGLLLAARNRGLKPSLLDLRNSGDTAGDQRRVVGYAAFDFREASADQASSHAGH